MEENSLTAIIEKINWLSSQQQISSIDVHPDNNRFLTCSAESINIWRATPYINSTKSSSSSGITAGDSMIKETELSSTSQSKVTTIRTESDFSIQQIANPNVSCARFSPDGRFIAAACDDFSVAIYKVSKAGQDRESWKTLKYFKNHTKDVLSVAWSSDSKYLASCSIDNSVIVYDMKAKNVGEIVLNSNEHANHVKGVTFDPIGKYLVSQSDTAVIIWILHEGNFTLHKKITNTFSMVGSMTYKPSFSPCGQYLLIPNCVSSGTFCAKIYLRYDNFEEGIPFFSVKNVWYTVFNPVIFKRNTKPWRLFAISTERSVSIYASDIPKPLMTIGNICKQPISDIVWSADGLSLLISSNDGSVHSFTFPQELFGPPLTTLERKAFLEQLYGDMELGSVLAEYPSSIFSVTQLASVVPQPRASNSIFPPTPASFSSPSPQPPTKPTITEKPKPVEQQRVEMVNGKKRIVPVHTSFDDDDDEEENIQKPATFSINLEKENLLNGLMSIRGDANAVVETSVGFDAAPATYSTEDILKVNTEVTKKRTRIEIDVDNSKKNKKKTKNPINPVRDLSTIDAEPIYLRLNARDELFCSLEGIVEMKSNKILKWKSTVSGTGSVLHSYPNQAAGTEFFIAICTYPSNMCHVFSTESGMRLLPPMVLDSKIEQINCSGDYLVAYTSELMFYVWDVRKQKCLVRCSADSLLSNTSTVSVERRIIDDIAVTSKGVGIVTLMSGESYAFDVNLNTWICVADSHSVFSPFLSQGRVNLEDVQEKTFDDAEVTLNVLRNKAAVAVQKFRLEHPEVTPTVESANIDTIDDLEIAMTSAAAIGDIGSYMFAVQSYAKHLSKLRDERLKDLFRSLLGPYKSTSLNWDPLVAGTPKRLVLKHLISILQPTAELSIKRLCTEFAVILSNILQEQE